LQSAYSSHGEAGESIILAYWCCADVKKNLLAGFNPTRRFLELFIFTFYPAAGISSDGIEGSTGGVGAAGATV
jgi:hypothetical protein